MGAGRIAFAVGLLGVLLGFGSVAKAAESWEFVDGEGVLHIGNVPAGVGSADSAPGIDTASLPVTGPAGTRDIKWINRTWTLRFPAWDPANSVDIRSNVAMRSTLAPQLPRGFNDVKPYLDAAAKSHSVDPALVYSVAAAESAFNADAVSHKGALGLMQIMPATAARYGISGYSLTTGRHNVLEPQVNAQVGGRYLAELLRRYGGDATLALAAYNAGEGAVSKYGNKIPPYPETQKYVERVLGYYRSFKQ